LSRVGWYARRKWRVLVRTIGFISTLVTTSLNYSQYGVIADLHGLQSQSYITTDGHSASLSWNKAPILGLRPDLCYCQTVTDLFVWGRSLWREDGSIVYTTAVGTRQRSHSRIRVPWRSWPYFTVSDSRLPFSSPPTTRRATVEVFDPASTREHGSARTTHRKHISCSATDIMYCCQACPPMHCLAMDALLLRIRCRDMCLPVCYLATLWANPYFILDISRISIYDWFSFNCIPFQTIVI
jgi:hypothetical protein